MIQEKVACLEDNDARLALDPQNRYRVQVLLDTSMIALF